MSGSGTGDWDVTLSDATQVRAALSAELQLIENLVSTAKQVRDAASGPAYQWLDKYWVRPLEAHVLATAAWRDGIDKGSDTLEAAKVELALVETLASQLEKSSGPNAAADAAFESWRVDFRCEAAAKRALIAALGP